MPAGKQRWKCYRTWTDEGALVFTRCKINSNPSGGFSLCFVTQNNVGPMAPTLRTHLRNIPRALIPKRNGQRTYDRSIFEAINNM